MFATLRKMTLVAASAAVLSGSLASFASAACDGYGGYSGSSYGHGYSSCHSRPVYTRPVYGRPVYTRPAKKVIVNAEFRRMYLLMKAHPELIKQHPDLAIKLNKQFGGGLAVEGISGGAAVSETTTVSQSQPAATAEVSEVTETTAEAAPAPNADATPAPAAEATPAPAAEAGPAPAAEEAAPAPADETPIQSVPADLPPGEPVEAPAAATATAESPVPSELQPLLGLWENEDGADQQVAKINLGADGNAQVTVNTGLGAAQVEGRFAVADGNFNLQKDDQTLTLGKVVSADKDRVVIERDGAQLAFVRPQ